MRAVIGGPLEDAEALSPERKARVSTDCSVSGEIKARVNVAMCVQFVLLLSCPTCT